MKPVTETVEGILAHYGVKGMKWGVRKRNVPRQGPSGDAKDAHRAFVKAKTSGVEALTNKELQSLNNRLNLEVRYAELSYQPSAIKKGVDTLSGLLKTGKTVGEAVNFKNTNEGKALIGLVQTKSKRARGK